MTGRSMYPHPYTHICSQNWPKPVGGPKQNTHFNRVGVGSSVWISRTVGVWAWGMCVGVCDQANPGVCIAMLRLAVAPNNVGSVCVFA